jgi:hypothetical protein
VTPRRALDEPDALVRRMWARPLPFRRRREQQTNTSARWQVSQVHLAVDVANAPLESEQLARYVTRSRKQALHHAAQAEIEQLLRSLDGEDRMAPPLLLDWDALYADDAHSAFDGFGLDGLGAVGTAGAGEDEPEPVEDRAATLYRFGSRLSGITFSPGGATGEVVPRWPTLVLGQDGRTRM